MPRGKEPENHAGRQYGDWMPLFRCEPPFPSVPGRAVPWMCQHTCGHVQALIPLRFKYSRVARCERCRSKPPQ